MEKRKTIFQTHFATHCIDLMLEDFEKKPKIHHLTTAKARKITTSIYAKTMAIRIQRHFTKGKDLVMSTITYFATTYLTFECLNNNKGSLMCMFNLKTQKSSKYASTKDGKIMKSLACYG